MGIELRVTIYVCHWSTHSTIPQIRIIGFVGRNGCIALHPELFRFVTVGFLLDPSTSDNKFDALRALANISMLSKSLSLLDTLYFFAISVLVGTILQYLEIFTLRSAITVGRAFPDFTEVMLEDAAMICCVFISRGAVLCDSC